MHETPAPDTPTRLPETVTDAQLAEAYQALNDLVVAAQNVLAHAGEAGSLEFLHRAERRAIGVLLVCEGRGLLSEVRRLRRAAYIARDALRTSKAGSKDSGLWRSVPGHDLDDALEALENAHPDGAVSNGVNAFTRLAQSLLPDTRLQLELWTHPHFPDVAGQRWRLVRRAPDGTDEVLGEDVTMDGPFAVLEGVGDLLRELGTPYRHPTLATPARPPATRPPAATVAARLADLRPDGKANLTGPYHWFFDRREESELPRLRVGPLEGEPAFLIGSANTIPVKKFLGNLAQLVGEDVPALLDETARLTGVEDAARTFLRAVALHGLVQAAVQGDRPDPLGRLQDREADVGEALRAAYEDLRARLAPRETRA